MSADPLPLEHVTPEPIARTAVRPAPDPTPLPPPRPRLAPGTAVPYRPAWTLVREVGRGGFGEVWQAKHEWKSERAAVKFCTHPGARVQLVSHEKNVIVRVMRHAGDHPQIVPLLDYDLTGDVPWLMYEYVEGGTLADALGAWRDLPASRRLSRAVLTLYGLARALKKVHKLDPPIVHRDLKPANILMARGLPRITDFGIGGAAVAAAACESAARRSGDEIALPTMLRAMGTNRYASPEQLFGSAPHPRDDVYALGIIAYQLVLADDAAVPGTDAADTLRERGAPKDLTSLIVRSVAMDPDRRPQNAREWERTLKQWMPKSPSGALPPPRPREAPPPAPAPQVRATARARKSDDVTAFNFALPGALLARPLGAPDAPWGEVTRTPAAVEMSPALAYCLRVQEKVSEAELEGLDALPYLVPVRHLNLSWCEQVTDAALAPLREYEALEGLDLLGCKQVTDAGLAHIRYLAGLEHLSLRWCARVTDAGVRRLRRLTALRALDLMGCVELTDDALGWVARLPRLRQLDLRWCDRLTDAGLLRLRPLAGLRALSVAHCAQLTDPGLAALRAALPGCQIDR